MADRRMFSKRVINSARFLKMPIDVQALYFHLGLNADDDGVVEAYMVMKDIGSTEEDLEILIEKGYVVVLNDDLVTYITDWNENNKIRSDRKKDSIHSELLNDFLNGAKTGKTSEILDNTNMQPSANQTTTKCQPNDNQVSTKCPHRIGKDRIGEDRIGEDRVGEVIEEPFQSVTQIADHINYNHIVDLYHEHCPSLTKVEKLTDKRKKEIKKILKKYSEADLVRAFDIAEQSSFLRGECNSPGHESFKGHFDFFFREDKLVSILEGKYSDNKNTHKPKQTQEMEDWYQMAARWAAEAEPPEDSSG